MHIENLCERLEKETCQRAIDKWGKQFQINMAIEECSELITKLIKRKRSVNGATDEEICDEIADVEIMMGQLRLIFDSSLIDKRKKYKINRLLRLLDGNGYD